MVLVLLDFLLGGVGFAGIHVGWCWFCWNLCWGVLVLLEIMLECWFCNKFCIYIDMPAFAHIKDNQCMLLL